MIYFIFGICFCILFIEPLIVNIFYFSNVHLFLDVVLWKKNVEKLREVFKND